jgi:integrase
LIGLDLADRHPLNHAGGVTISDCPHPGGVLICIEATALELLEEPEASVLGAIEARQLSDSIDTTSVVGLRDRALIGLLVFTFARIGAALGMTVADIYWQHRRLWVRLHEKGGTILRLTCRTTSRPQASPAIAREQFSAPATGARAFLRTAR